MEAKLNTVTKVFEFFAAFRARLVALGLKVNGRKLQTNSIQVFF
jgi:hypothetical protein